MPETKYFSHAWKLLTGNKGWLKVVLLLSLCLLVPIVGALGVLGYLYEWGRLVAWGVDASPKQKNIDVGGCIKSGWRVFVVNLGYYAVWFLVVAFFTNLAGGELEGLPALLVWACGLFLATFVHSASLRASIYQKIGGGYQVNRLWDMVRRDFAGFAKVTGIRLLVAAVCGLIICVPAIVFVFYVAGASLAFYPTLSMNTQVSSLIGPAMTALVVLLAVALVLYVFGMIMSAMLVSLWFRQFDVPAWGASKDPLPQTQAYGAYGVQPPTPAQGQQGPGPQDGVGHQGGDQQ